VLQEDCAKLRSQLAGTLLTASGNSRSSAGDEDDRMFNFPPGVATDVLDAMGLEGRAGPGRAHSGQCGGDGSAQCQGRGNSAFTEDGHARRGGARARDVARFALWLSTQVSEPAVVVAGAWEGN